jgi:hypothetical protein
VRLSRPHRSRRLLAAPLAAFAVSAAVGAGSAGAASFVPAPGSPLPVGAQPYSVLAQDLDGDGRGDVAAMNGTSSNLSVFLGTGAGAFAAASGSPFATGLGPSGIAVADFDGDGRQDIAVSAYSGGSASILRGQPGGTWVPEAGGTVSTPGAGAVAAADVNGDGRPDLLVTDYDAGGVYTFLRKAEGGFQPDGAAPTGANPRAIAVADFNGDGLPDLAVTNFGSATVSVLLRQPLGGWAAEGAPLAVGQSPIGIVARDLNGDGRPDLAVANYGSGNVSILLRQAGGGFAPEAGSPVATAAGTTGVAVPDLDGDGRPDLVATNNAAGTMSVLLRRGGAYEPLADSPLTLPTGPSGVAAGDVDGDGRPDLVAASDQANVLNVLLSRIPPAGEFVATSPTFIGQIVEGLAAGKLRVPGAGGKVGPLLTKQLNRVPLASSFTSGAASSTVTTKGTGVPATPDPAIGERLAAYAYGIPVTVIGEAGEVVGIAGAVAELAKAGSGSSVTTVRLPVGFYQLDAGANTFRLPVDAKAADALKHNGVDEAAIQISAQEIAVDKAAEAAEDAKRQADDAIDRKKKIDEEIRKILAILNQTNGVHGRPAPHHASAKEMRKRAAGLAKRSNALSHRVGVLLSPVLRAHPVRPPRATFAVRPCPKKCAYPSFGR